MFKHNIVGTLFMKIELSKYKMISLYTIVVAMRLSWHLTASTETYIHTSGGLTSFPHGDIPATVEEIEISNSAIPNIDYIEDFPNLQVLTFTGELSVAVSPSWQCKWYTPISQSTRKQDHKGQRNRTNDGIENIWI